MEGIQWILHYYYHGVQSWSWWGPQALLVSSCLVHSDKLTHTLRDYFWWQASHKSWPPSIYERCVCFSRYYPYHYAPFLSDIRNLSGLKLTFDLAKPFMPFQQLLAVLPAASMELLPECYRVIHTHRIWVCIWKIMTTVASNIIKLTTQTSINKQWCIHFIVSAPDDQWKFSHYWVLPPGL